MTSSKQNSLLIELLTEELPPKSLKLLGQNFSQAIFAKLVELDLVKADSQYNSYATPRRLAVLISDVREVAPDFQMREKLLPVSIAIDANGQATPPLMKKLNSLGQGNFPIADLEKSGIGKNESLFINFSKPGKNIADGAQIALDFSLTQLPIAKVMSYQLNFGTDSEVDVSFVRPAHRLVALYGADILPIKAMGLFAGRITLGHRFLSSGDLNISNASDYELQLETTGYVIPNFSKRLELIQNQLNSAANSRQVLMPQALLEEVNSLVEWPQVYQCSFEKEFLEVPQECLILTMQTNQKYFALTNHEGKLINQFLIVSNIETTRPDAIISGNERVIRPRLADAKFFYTQDKKRTLASRVKDLEQVTYHNKLGSQYLRCQRVKEIASHIANMVLELPNLKSVSPHLVEYTSRAATLAKTDLLTDMVSEFPELQGTMGTYYAYHDGEVAEVAEACSEHYMPRFAGDDLPKTYTGTVLALADKLETLVGIWSIGLHPTGEKDPFALRRHALGICRLLIEKNLSLYIIELLQVTLSRFTTLEIDSQSIISGIQQFIYDRLKTYLKDFGGNTYSTNEIDAILSLEPYLLCDLPGKLHAVHQFSLLPESADLANANKRIGNILKKISDLPTTQEVNLNLLIIPAEINLFKGIEKISPEMTIAFTEKKFEDYLSLIATLHLPVNDFFDEVMVMDPNIDLRNNRITILKNLFTQMNQIADLSKLAQ